MTGIKLTCCRHKQNWNIQNCEEHMVEKILRILWQMPLKWPKKCLLWNDPLCRYGWNRKQSTGHWPLHEKLLYLIFCKYLTSVLLIIFKILHNLSHKNRCKWFWSNVQVQSPFWSMQPEFEGDIIASAKVEPWIIFISTSINHCANLFCRTTAIFPSGRLIATASTGLIPVSRSILTDPGVIKREICPRA